MTELQIEPELFWGTVWAGGFFLALVVVFGAFPKNTHHVAPLVLLQRKMGLEQVNSGLFFLAVVLWLALFGLLFVGLTWLIWDMIWQNLPGSTVDEEFWRLAFAKLTATAAVFGVVVAFPITLVRLDLTQTQTNTAQDALFNDKINAASADLHAMRQRWKDQDQVWEDDIIRRIAAIDRLEGLINERPDIAPRVSRMLSAYVRELSKEVTAQPAPETESDKNLQVWANSLPVQRADMEEAVQALGRFRKIPNVDPSNIEIDLRRANLQSFDLSDLDFTSANFSMADAQNAIFSKSKFLGAKFSKTRLTAATLSDCQLSKIHFFRCELQHVDFSRSQLEEVTMFFSSASHASLVAANLKSSRFLIGTWLDTNFRQADLSGAQLNRIKLSGPSCLEGTNLNGAAILNADLIDVEFSQEQIASMFFDGSSEAHGITQDDFSDREVLDVPSRMITLILADWRFLWHARC